MPTAVVEHVPLDTEKMKRLRLRLGLSQIEAAKLAGLQSAQAWNNIERGRRQNLQLLTLEKIAAALGVKAKDLLK